MSLTNESPFVYEFGAFRLDPSERLLLREGQTVQLAPKVFDTLIAALSSRIYVDSYYLASAYVALGKKEEAIARLEIARRERSCWLIRLRVDPLFDSLRGIDGFDDVLEGVGAGL